MDTVAYLLERYPEDFVQAISTGATCDVIWRFDTFPILDVMGGRIEMAATIYAVTQAYENMTMMAASFRDATLPILQEAAEQVSAMANAKEVLERANEKESGRRTEERQERHEGRADQPWRKRHR
jgi:hypothetical protein